MKPRISLSKTLRKNDMFALAFGAMIGWGWVVLANTWLEMGGVLGATIAFVIGSFMCMMVSLVYAELMSAMPVAGGPVAFTYRGMGSNWSWVTGWFLVLAYVSVAAWESVAVTAALNFIVPLPEIIPLWTIAGEQVYLTWCLPGILLSLGITYLNVRGVRLSAIVQNLTTALLVITGLLFVLVSLFKGDAANLSPLYTSTSGVSSVLMMVPFMMVGFDVVPQSAEETDLPHRTLARYLILAVVSAAFWYISITWALAYSVPVWVRNSSQIAVGTAIAHLLNQANWGKFLVFGGICGILSSWNAFLVAGSRVIFGLARARMIPSAFARVNPRSNAPSLALTLVGMVCAISPLLGTNILNWLVNVGGFCTCATYMLVSLSFIRLRKSQPDMSRPFRAGKTLLVGFLAVIITGMFLILYLPIGPSSLKWPYEWAILGVWVGVGLLGYKMSETTLKQVSPAERSYLLLGESFSRSEMSDFRR